MEQVRCEKFRSGGFHWNLDSSSISDYLIVNLKLLNEAHRKSGYESQPTQPANEFMESDRAQHLVPGKQKYSFPKNYGWDPD